MVIISKDISLCQIEVNLKIEFNKYILSVVYKLK